MFISIHIKTHQTWVSTGFQSLKMWMTLFQVSKTLNLLQCKALSFARVLMPANRGIDSDKK